MITPDQARETVCDWLEANGIDPADVPQTGIVQVNGWLWNRRLTVEITTGWDPNTVKPINELRTVLRTVPLQRRPPRNLAELLFAIRHLEIV